MGCTVNKFVAIIAVCGLCACSFTTATESECDKELALAGPYGRRTSDQVCDLKPYHADETFTQEEQAKVIRAEALVAQAFCAPSVGVIFDLPHPPDPHIQCGRGQILKSTKGGGGQFLPNYGCMSIGTMFPDQVEPIVAHELGHFRGLGHLTDTQPGIMNGTPTQSIWTKEDQAACEAKGMCLCHHEEFEQKEGL